MVMEEFHILCVSSSAARKVFYLLKCFCQSCFVPFYLFDGTDSKTELQMMYAGSKLELVKVAELTKVFEIRELEELTEEWLHSKLLK